MLNNTFTFSVKIEYYFILMAVHVQILLKSNAHPVPLPKTPIYMLVKELDKKLRGISLLLIGFHFGRVLVEVLALRGGLDHANTDTEVSELLAVVSLSCVTLEQRLHDA